MIIILIIPFLVMTSTEIAPTPQTAAEAATSDQPVIRSRPRRLRRKGLRRLVREHHLTTNDLIYPVFVMAEEWQKEAIPSMPGCYRYTRIYSWTKSLISSDLKGHPFTRHLGQSRGIGYRRRRADEALYSWEAHISRE